MKVLSLFDGMACGALALQAVGIEIENYDALEIDKYAIKTTSHNFPFIKHHGDVFKADFTQFEGVDLVCGGSPCTYWSIAQKNNRETEASGLGWELFQQYVRAIKEAKPKFFIYENNKSMSKDIRASIDKAFGFEAVLINSALVSAQNRQRLYWVGKRNPDGTYSKVDIEQPKDRGIILKDVLDGDTDREKARAIIYSIGRTTEREYFIKSQGTMTFEPVCPMKNGKARCVTAGYANKGAKHILESNFSNNPHKQQWDSIAEPVRIGHIGSTAQAHRVYSCEGKARSLIANAGGQGGKTGLYAIPVEFDGDIPTKAISGSDGKIYRVYEVKDGLITIKGKQYEINLADGYYIIRKLTITECKRLQTVPDSYEFPVSDTQAYKMLGNGWTVAVIAHLISSILKNEQ